jgi:hypothetical protein
MIPIGDELDDDELDDVERRAGTVTPAEAREILTRFNASHWHHKDLGERARYSIPADPRRDDDIRLGVFIDQAERAIAERDRLRAEVERLAAEVERLRGPEPDTSSREDG